MQKTRTRGTGIRRGLRQGIALFFGVVGLWLLWLTGDPRAALANWVGERDLAAALLAVELPMPGDGDGLGLWERLMVGQSPLLEGQAVGSAPPEETETPQSLPSQEVAPTEVPAPSDTPAPSTTAPEGIIPKTMVAGTSSKYITQEGVTIYNHTDYALDIPTLLANAPTLSAQKEGPQILIFHSHATEAYTMDGTDLYEESDSYRTLNTEQNMVRIGAEMTKVFEAAGLEVIHDTTLYDYPSYNDAYTRSSQGVAQWLEQYPSIQLVLDVHRDALAASDGTLYKTVTGTVDNCAQVMMVMGSDAIGQEHPNWRINLGLAVRIQQALVEKWATLARPVVLRTSRFNQHQSTGEILVEVGTHGNTLQEAITAARLYARTVADLMKEG